MSDSEKYRTGKNVRVSVNGVVIEQPNDQSFIVNNRTKTIYPTSRPANFHRELWADEVDNSPENSLTCNHMWENYQGVYESFDYCKTCDIKRG